MNIEQSFSLVMTSVIATHHLLFVSNCILANMCLNLRDIGSKMFYNS